MADVYKMADRVTEINSIHPDVHEYGRDNRAYSLPDITLTITQADIDFEREKFARTITLSAVMTAFQKNTVSATGISSLC